MASTFFSKILLNRTGVLLFLTVIAIAVSIQNVLLGPNNFWGGDHTHYNNYVIFKTSFWHLLQNKNLFEYYPQEYADLYKYSPTFALFMGLFAGLPDTVGLILWNLLNVAALYFAVYGLKMLSEKQKPFLLLFLLLETITSLQNSQSNILILALIIIAYNLLESNKPIYATLLIALGFFIKVYSGIGCILLLFYPNKIKNGLLLFGWCLVLFFLPAMVCGVPALLQQYLNWEALLKMDADASLGMSVFLYMQHIVPVQVSKTVTLVLAAIVLLAPLLLFKKYGQSVFRLLYLCLLLIWMVVFNHKAESPTFVIAMAGIGIWFFVNEKTTLRKVFFIASLVFTSVWFTDIVPNSVKDLFVDRMYVKPLFPILVLGFIFYDLFYFKPAEN